MNISHIPVLLNQTLDYLSPQSDNLLIDCTLGEGGHTQAFLYNYPSLRVIALERDKTILAKAKERLEPFKDRISFFNTWFNEFLENTDVKADRILFDLGISNYHYKESERGFSFTKEEPLDMRLNLDQIRSAYDVVNTFAEKELADLIFNYSQERYSRRIAKAICTKRKESKIRTSKELADIIYKAVPQGYRYSSNHPATKTFQAIRIQVNDELNRIRGSIIAAVNLLKPGGRVGVISFHSLEDRIVKNLFKELERDSYIEILTKKPLVADEDEIKLNSPSRVAKLRVAAKRS